MFDRLKFVLTAKGEIRGKVLRANFALGTGYEVLHVSLLQVVLREALGAELEFFGLLLLLLDELRIVHNRCQHFLDS